MARLERTEEQATVLKCLEAVHQELLDSAGNDKALALVQQCIVRIKEGQEIPSVTSGDRKVSSPGHNGGLDQVEELIQKIAAVVGQKQATVGAPAKMREVVVAILNLMVQPMEMSSPGASRLGDRVERSNKTERDKNR